MRSGVSDVPEAPETPVAPVRRSGRPPGRQNNATLDARAFYKPKAKKLANKKIKAANVILDRYLDGGKVTDAELTFAERVSTQCAHYAFGKPKETTEISGPEGAPIQSETVPLTPLETARRVAWVFDRAGRESQTEGAPRSDPAPPNSPTASARAPLGGQTLATTSPENPQKKSGEISMKNPTAARSSDSAPRGATAPAADVPVSPSAAAPAPFSPDIAGTHSDVYGWVDGGHAPITAEGEDTPAAACQPDREPVPGEVAHVAGYEIRCKERQRENTPVIFEIWDDTGIQVRYPVNGYQLALKKIRELAGENADMAVTISKPRPVGGASRPDERAGRSMSAPVLHGSYSHRK